MKLLVVSLYSPVLLVHVLVLQLSFTHCSCLNVDLRGEKRQASNYLSSCVKTFSFANEEVSLQFQGSADLLNNESLRVIQSIFLQRYNDACCGYKRLQSVSVTNVDTLTTKMNISSPGSFILNFDPRGIACSNCQGDDQDTERHVSQPPCHNPCGFDFELFQDLFQSSIKFNPASSDLRLYSGDNFLKKVDCPPISETTRIESSALIHILVRGGGTISASDFSFLKDGFLQVYNNLAICDPKFRSVDLAAFLVRPPSSHNSHLHQDNIFDTTNKRNTFNSSTFQQSRANSTTSGDDYIVTIQILISGSCRGCQDGTNIFDDGLNQRMQAEPGSRRYLQQPASALHDDVCYCAISFPDVGPTSTMFEVEYDNFVQQEYRLGRIEKNVRVVGVEEIDRQQSFESTVYLGLLAADPIEPAELSILEAEFESTYNALNDGRCDRHRRRVSHTRFVVQGIRRLGDIVNADNSITVDETRDLDRRRVTTNYKLHVNGTCQSCSANISLFEYGGMEGSASVVRLHGNRLLRERRENEQSPAKRSNDLVKRFHRRFKDDEDHRVFRSSQNDRDDENFTVGSINDGTAPTTDEFASAYNQKLNRLFDNHTLTSAQGVDFVSENADHLQQVDCPAAKTRIESNVFVEFLMYENFTETNFSLLENGFMQVYNSLPFCDPKFRSVEHATFSHLVSAVLHRQPQQNNASSFDKFTRAVPLSGSMSHNRTRSTTSQENSTALLNQQYVVKFQITTQGTCRGCPVGTNLFDDGFRRSRALSWTAPGSRRNTQTSLPTSNDDVCYCSIIFPGNGPTTSAFEMEYNDFIQKEKELGRLDKLVRLIGVEKGSADEKTAIQSLKNDDSGAQIAALSFWVVLFWTFFLL